MPTPSLALRLTVGSAPKLVLKSNALSFQAVGDLSIEDANASSYGFTASSSAGDVTVSGRVKPWTVGAPTTISAPAGTCDVSGFSDLADRTVTYDCATVVGP